MNMPDRDEQRKLVKQWAHTGRELDEIRREELRDMPYDWKAVDSLLQLADSYDGPERTTSGLVEMQRYFMKLYPKYFPVDESD